MSNHDSAPIDKPVSTTVSSTAVQASPFTHSRQIQVTPAHRSRGNIFYMNENDVHCKNVGFLIILLKVISLIPIYPPQKE